MATNNVSTNELQGLIPAEISSEIIKDVAQGSVMMRLANTVPMNTPTKQFPVELTKAGAYWVGEGQKITVDKASWATVELVAKKLAVIVPATREALQDGSINVLQEVKGQIAEAMASAFDDAALFGTNSPYGAGKSIVEKAKAGGKKIQATANLIKDLSDVMGLVEDEELDVNAFVSTRALKAELRNAENGAGYSIFEDKTQDAPARLHGEPLVFSKNFDKTAAKVVTGDFDKVYVGVLDGIDYQISTEGTVGDINLFEQDMVAVRATMRVGFLVIKDEAFAVVEPAVARKK